MQFRIQMSYFSFCLFVFLNQFFYFSVTFDDISESAVILKMRYNKMPDTRYSSYLVRDHLKPLFHSFFMKISHDLTTHLHIVKLFALRLSTKRDNMVQNSIINEINAIRKETVVTQIFKKHHREI